MQYEVLVSKRYKRVSIHITPKGQLVIRTPRQLSKIYAEEILTNASSWIEKHMQKHRAAANPLFDGAEITLFGDTERLKFITATGKPRVEDAGSELQVIAPDKHIEVFQKWIRKVARQGIENRVQELALQYNFKYNRISVRDQTTRWGSCSSKRNLNFSWRLALAPLEVMDYVIIHELAHTQQMNHSQNFWNIVANCMPDYEQYKQWLKQNTHLLHSY